MDTTHHEPGEAGPAAAASDAELAGRASRGNASAFEAIMRRHNRLVFRTARGVLDDDAEAMDAVQETWLRAFLSLGGFRGEASLGTWLARIAVNVALDARRRLRRNVPIDDAARVDGEFETDYSMDYFAPDAERPDARAERSETRALLQGAIDSLPAIYRSVFVLRSVEEMSVSEAAYCLQLSEDVIKTRHLRARSLLRDALGARVEAYVQHAYAFDGDRCDRIVARVLEELRRQGRIRDGAPGPCAGRDPLQR